MKDHYKGAFNFRVGGELKFNIIMARLGFAYYSDPYKEKALKGSKMLLSGGLGYRNKGFFIDLTYVHNVSKDINFPYRLNDRENTYASLKQTQGNISATVGFKF
jgi:long-subunit fatty acid transport protein